MKPRRRSTKKKTGRSRPLRRKVSKKRSVTGPRRKVSKKRSATGPRRQVSGDDASPASPKASEESGIDAEGRLRLNRYLAVSGVCSRRAADELIRSGAVTIDGEVVGQLGVKLDPRSQDVRVDGERVRPDRPVYVMFHKPVGVVCTNADDEKRPRVIDCLPRVKGRLFTVGRLDADSRGLILVTNDGYFAQAVAHPRHGIKKTYEVVVRGQVHPDALRRLRNGVWIGDGTTSPARVDILRPSREKTSLRITLSEGKNREIRRMCAKVGHPVLSLKRVSIARLRLHGLGEGRHRLLTHTEVSELMELALS